MAPSKRKAAAAATAKMSKSAAVDNKKKKNSPTSTSSTAKTLSKPKITESKKKPTNTQTTTGPSNDDDDYLKPGDKGFFQCLYSPDRIKTGEDWYDYNFYVAPKNTSPPWATKDSLRVYCTVCDLVYPKGNTTNSNAIKNHCNDPTHTHNVCSHPLEKVIVNDKIIQVLDKNGRSLVGAQHTGLRKLPQQSSVVALPQTNCVSTTTTKAEKLKFDTQLKQLVLSSSDMLKSYGSFPKEFRNFFQALRPGYNPTTDAALHFELHQTRDSHVAETIAMLSKLPSITIEISLQGCFIVVRGRFIDDSFHVCSKLLTVVDTRKGHDMFSSIAKTLRVYNLEPNRIDHLCFTGSLTGTYSKPFHSIG